MQTRLAYSLPLAPTYYRIVKWIIGLQTRRAKIMMIVLLLDILPSCAIGDFLDACAKLTYNLVRKPQAKMKSAA